MYTYNRNSIYGNRHQNYAKDYTAVSGNYYDRVHRLNITREENEIEMPQNFSGYFSYLGVPIVEQEDKYDKGLLGMTNRKMIMVKELKGNARSKILLKKFVLFHEEEHVKDFDADEKTVDERAFRRLMRSGLAQDKQDLSEILALLRSRWTDISEFLALISHLSSK